MPATINHQDICGKADGTDPTQIQPSWWNKSLKVGGFGAKGAIPFGDATKTAGIDFVEAVARRQQFVSVGAGAPPAWQTKPHCDIRDYRDGVVSGTDVTDAIQGTISAAGLGTVLIPAGEWLHTGLTVTDSTHFAGVCSEFSGSWLRHVALSGNAFTVDAAGKSPSFRDLVISGSRLMGLGATTSVGLHLHCGGGNVLFDRCVVNEFGSHGVVLEGEVFGVTFRQSRSIYNGGDGIFGLGKSTAQINAIRILESDLSDNLGNGINVWGVAIAILCNIIENNGLAGVRLDASSITDDQATASGVQVVGNYFEANPLGCVRAHTAYNAPYARYLGSLVIRDNYLSQDVAVSDVSTTAAIMLSGVVGSYRGLDIGPNAWSTTGVAMVDCGVAVDRRGSVWLDLGPADTFSAQYLGTQSGVSPTWANVPTGDVDVGYGTTCVIDTRIARTFKILATDRVGFTIAAPTNPIQGQRIAIVIKNTSGGALGTVTWDSAYKMATWTSPATGYSRSIEFVYDWDHWREVSRTSADVPN